jgi:hypothetical protein
VPAGGDLGEGYGGHRLPFGPIKARVVYMFGATHVQRLQRRFLVDAVAALPNYDHLTHPELLAERVHVALVGAGGIGSLMLSGLARLDAAIRALGHPGLDVTVYDPDDVSEANLGRQLFAPADVGRNKAHRARHAHQRLVRHALERPAAQVRPGRTRRPGENAIGIVCQLRRQRPRARAIGQEIGTLVLDAALLAGPRQPRRRRPGGARHPAVGRRARGATCTGCRPCSSSSPSSRRRRHRSTTTTGPSCSLAQALERQELFVNQAVVTPALQLLWLCSATAAPAGAARSSTSRPAAWRRCPSTPRPGRASATTPHLRRPGLQRDRGAAAGPRGEQRLGEAACRCAKRHSQHREP